MNFQKRFVNFPRGGATTTTYCVLAPLQYIYLYRYHLYLLNQDNPILVCCKEGDLVLHAIVEASGA